MDAIIRTPALSGTTRQLRRSGMAPLGSAAVPALAAVVAVKASGLPDGPVAPLPPASAVQPILSDAPGAPAFALPVPPAPEEAAWMARRRLADEKQAAAERAISERDAALQLRAQALDTRQRSMDDQAAGELRDAAERGYAQGLERGEAEAAKRALAAAQEEARTQGQTEQALRQVRAEQAARFDGVCAALQASQAALLAQAEDLLVEIAYTAVCRLLGQDGAARATVVHAVQGLIHEAREAGQLRLHVHPQDMDLLHGVYGAGAEADRRVQLLPDAAVELGGCLVETPHGTLDARLEVQLRHLAEALLVARRARASVQVAD